MAEQSVLSTALGLEGENPKKLPLFEGDLSQYQEDVLAQNKKISPQAIELGDIVNTANTQQLLKMMESLIPGYGKLIGQGTENAAALMRGELPEDVKRSIADFGAQRGIASGTSGSNFADFSTLRSYGISSLQAQEQGLNQFLNISQRAPKPPQFDFTSMFLSPGQKAQFEMNKFQMNLPIVQFNNWVDSLPSNIERAADHFLDWVATQGTSVLSAYTGGMMGGMGGGGGGSGGMGGMGGMMGGGGGGGGGSQVASASNTWSQAPVSFGMPGGTGQGAGVGTGEGGPMGYGGGNLPDWMQYQY